MHEYVIEALYNVGVL